MSKRFATGRARPGPVVCGVNGSSSSRRALGEALLLAAASGGRLVVVTAYDEVGFYWGALASLPWSDLLPVPRDAGMQASEEGLLWRFVESVLADRRLVPAGSCASVAIETRAVPGLPVDVLVRESVGAEVLVVGHGEDHGALASVAAGCSRRARCPVVVVPLGSFDDEPAPTAHGRSSAHGVI